MTKFDKIKVLSYILLYHAVLLDYLNFIKFCNYSFRSVKVQKIYAKYC